MSGLLSAWPRKVARIACGVIFVCSVLVVCQAQDDVQRHIQPIPKSQVQEAPYHQLKCEYYDPVKCLSGDGACGHTQVLCNSTASDKKIHCYALWRNNSGQVNLTKQGCWTDPNDDCHNTECVEERHGQRDPFCCCSGELCNREYHLRPVGPPPTPTPVGSVPPPVYKRRGHLLTILKSLMPITAIFIIVVLIFWMWRRHKANYHEPLPTHDPNPLPPESPNIGLRPLQLKELRNRGRYGAVWSAKLFQETVAVKIFPFHEQRSWMQERDIYMIPHMNNHPNILRFIGAEKRIDQSVQEFWLISEFHERGSLYDYLKGNLITWPQLVHIAQTMARGLAYLHEDVPFDKLGQRKPAIAHRDFKSKNVLIKNDLSCCLADFGLALKFEPGQNAGDTHGQVGTWRYMAPEVLEGAINFNRDAFLRIDMYACGLVLWELVSRCSASDGPIPDYQLPFESEVGLRMTLEDINEVVVQKKLRPQLKDHWYKHSGLASMIDTMQECWDQDAEARVSAGCIEERFTQLRKGIDQTLFSLAPPPSTIVTIPPTEEQVTCPAHLVPSNNALSTPSPNAVNPSLMTTMNISPTSRVNQDSYDSALEKSAVSSSSSDNQTSSDESLTVSLPEVTTLPSSATTTTVVALSSPRHNVDSNSRESTSPPRESTI